MSVGNINDLQRFYSEIKDGKYQTYDQMVTIVQKICNLIPDLNPKSGGKIENFNQQQLTKIINSFIKHIQKSQMKSNENKAFQNKSNVSQEYAESQWQNIYKAKYAEFRTSFADIPRLLNIVSKEKDHAHHNKKIFECFQKLGLQNNIIFVPKFHCFVDIDRHDRSGKLPKKINAGEYKKMIQSKIDNNQIDPFVKTTPEYKYFLSLLQKAGAMKKQTRLDKQLNKNARNRDSVMDVSKQIIHKFEQLKNPPQKIIVDRNTGQRKANKNYYQTMQALNQTGQNNISGTKQIFEPLKRKFKDAQVIDRTNEVLDEQKEKNKNKLSEKMVSEFAYVPKKVKEYLLDESKKNDRDLQMYISQGSKINRF